MNMKANENMFNYKVLIISGLAIMFGVLGSAWGICKQDNPQPQATEFEPGGTVAKYAALVDGTAACGNVNGQVGCRIDNGQGECNARDPITQELLFTASSSIASDGTVDWKLIGEFKFRPDVVITGGGSAGNACGYFYPDEAIAGYGLGNLKSNGQYSNVTFVDVCTDLQNEPERVELPIVQSCPEDIQDALNETQLANTGFALAYQFDNTLGVVSTLCVKGGLDNPNPASDDPIVIPCTNEPNPGGTESVELCSEVVSPETGEPFEFKNSPTYTVTGLKGSNCAFTCLPPPLTFDGRNQCGYICQ